MSFHTNPKAVTNGLVVCLDANNRKCFPDGADINTGWEEYNNQSQHYNVLGKDSVVLLNTTTNFVGRFASPVTSTGDYFLSFDYVTDDATSASLVVDNDGINNNMWNTTLTPSTTKQSYFSVKTHTTTGTSQMYLRRLGGGNITITNYRFGPMVWTNTAFKGNATIKNAIYNTSGYFTLDGNGDYFILDDDDSSIFANDTDFTIEIWCAKDQDNSNTSPMMLHYRGLSSYPAIGFIAYGTNGNYSDYGFTCEVDNDQDGDGTTGTAIFSKRNVSIDPNGWAQHVGVYKKVSTTHYGKVYLNGVYKDQATTTNSLVWKKPTNPYNGGITIGSSAHSTGNTTHSFEGKMGLIRIYNRALTDDEILQNFNAHKTRFGI